MSTSACVHVCVCEIHRLLFLHLISGHWAFLLYVPVMIRVAEAKDLSHIPSVT